MATVSQFNSACTEVVSDDECHILRIYSDVSGSPVIFNVEDDEETTLFSTSDEKLAIEWASVKVEELSRQEPIIDVDDGDDGWALASAGMGTDEDYSGGDSFE